MVGLGRLRDLFSLLLGLACFLPVLLRGMSASLQSHTILQLFSLMLPQGMSTQLVIKDHRASLERESGVG